MRTRRRLKEAGIHLKPYWEQELERMSKECDRYLLESFRLWLAAYVKALERGRVTQKARDNMLFLWQTACEVLNPTKPLKLYEMGVEPLKSRFPPILRERGLSVKSIMHYWPEERHFEQVRKASYAKVDFEKMRRELDFYQAYRDELRRRRDKEPKAKILCSLLHRNLMTHINDTREELQRGSIDSRRPQKGISIRTFRTRYPRAGQKIIIAQVRRILSAPTSIDEKPYTGKTPVRDSTDSMNERDGGL